MFLEIDTSFTWSVQNSFFFFNAPNKIINTESELISLYLISKITFFCIYFIERIILLNIWFDRIIFILNIDFLLSRNVRLNFKLIRTVIRPLNSTNSNFMFNDS